MARFHQGTSVNDVEHSAGRHPPDQGGNACFCDFQLSLLTRLASLSPILIKASTNVQTSPSPALGSDTTGTKPLAARIRETTRRTSNENSISRPRKHVRADGPQSSESGHQMTVWNRTRERATGISGAVAANTPSEAAKNTEIAVTMLADDQAESCAHEEQN